MKGQGANRGTASRLGLAKLEEDATVVLSGLAGKMFAMLPRLHPHIQRQFQNALDVGGPVPRELALAVWQELIARQAITDRWAALLKDSRNEHVRKAGLGLHAALELPPHNERPSEN